MDSYTCSFLVFIKFDFLEKEKLKSVFNLFFNKEREETRVEKKKLFLLILVLEISLFTLSACSGASQEQVAGEGMAEEYKAYETHLQETFGKGDDLLSIFSTSLDGLYTETTSSNQFGSILKENVIKDSRELVKKVESYNVSPELFDLNQVVASHINSQHQLFLEAASMALEDNLSKESLHKSDGTDKRRTSHYNQYVEKTIEITWLYAKRPIHSL